MVTKIDLIVEPWIYKKITVKPKQGFLSVVVIRGDLQRIRRVFFVSTCHWEFKSYILVLFTHAFGELGVWAVKSSVKWNFLPCVLATYFLSYIFNILRVFLLSCNNDFFSLQSETRIL